MTLTLEEDEVEQYFAMREEHSQLLATVNELAMKLSQAQSYIERLKDEEEPALEE